jgi:hypothetical protein
VVYSNKIYKKYFFGPYLAVVSTQPQDYYRLYYCRNYHLRPCGYFELVLFAEGNNCVVQLIHSFAAFIELLYLFNVPQSISPCVSVDIVSGITYIFNLRSSSSIITWLHVRHSPSEIPTIATIFSLFNWMIHFNFLSFIIEIFAPVYTLKLALLHFNSFPLLPRRAVSVFLILTSVILILTDCIIYI